MALHFFRMESPDQEGLSRPDPRGNRPAFAWGNSSEEAMLTTLPSYKLLRSALTGCGAAADTNNQLFAHGVRFRPSATLNLAQGPVPGSWTEGPGRTFRTRQPERSAGTRF